MKALYDDQHVSQWCAVMVSILIQVAFRLPAETDERYYDDIPASNISLVQQDLDEDFADFSATCLEEDGGSLWETSNWESPSEIAYGVEIPISLLSGPWTDDMIKHLFWLVRSGARIDWVQSTLGEVLSSLHYLLMMLTLDGR